MIWQNAAMATYREYCPIAVGAEVLGDRWTPLVLRELILGSRGFNEIHRGVSRMSRSLLSQRLREFERRGIVERRVHPSGRRTDYVLTPSGRELEPVVWSLGTWAARWSFGDPEDEQLDAALLVWRLHQFVRPEDLPRERTVVQFVIQGPGGGEAWLVLEPGGSTACQIDPGYDVDLVVMGDDRELHRWLLGRSTFQELRRSGGIRFIGPTRLAQAFPRWFSISPFGSLIRAQAEADTLAAAG